MAAAAETADALFLFHARVAGVPLSFFFDRRLAPGPDGTTFGEYHPAAGVIALSPSSDEDRVRRAAIHELLHVMDDVNDLQLTHSQIRSLATGITTFFNDPANAQLLRFLE